MATTELKEMWRRKGGAESDAERPTSAPESGDPAQGRVVLDLRP